MEFTLFYDGPLPTDAKACAKQSIRREFHKQMKALWEHRPLSALHEAVLMPTHPTKGAFTRSKGPFEYVCLVNEKVSLVAELDFLVLWPDGIGSLVGYGGDIDNRLKTLFDALSMPQQKQQLPAGDTPKDDEKPFYCLLEDDRLITRVNVRTDRLLQSAKDERRARVHIHVQTKAIEKNYLNMGL